MITDGLNPLTNSFFHGKTTFRLRV